MDKIERFKKIWIVTIPYMTDYNLEKDLCDLHKKVKLIEDPYTILGVQKNASISEIHYAYRLKIRTWHTDKVSYLFYLANEYEGSEKVKDINDAKTTIREYYERSLLINLAFSEIKEQFEKKGKADVFNVGNYNFKKQNLNGLEYTEIFLEGDGDVNILPELFDAHPYKSLLKFGREDWTVEDSFSWDEGIII